MTYRNYKDYLFTGTQFLLFIAYLFDFQFLIVEIPLWLEYGGLILTVMGIILSFVAIFQLRKSLSPFPSPLPEAHLITYGVFSYIRHPIYSGILLAGLGYALYSDSLYRMLITLLLYDLFYYKSRYEEKMLTEKFSSYGEYKRRTGRFWP